MRVHLPSVLLLGVVACAAAPKAPDDDASPGAEATMSEGEVATWIAAEVEAYRPLSVSEGRAWFEASVKGGDEAWAKVEEASNALDRFLSERGRFERLRAARAPGVIADPLLARQVESLYLSALPKQVDPALLERLNALGTEVEKAFNAYRGELGGKPVSQNEIEEVLRTSTDSAELQRAWEAQKGIGPLVAPKLRELVGLRNEVARSLGFRDYYALRLEAQELDEEALLALFDRLDELTREPFLAAKAEVDARLSKRLGVPAAELKPWHYQNPFFQAPPEVYETGLEALYEEQDTLALCRRFYESIGLPVEAILERSDLYEREGKTPHAFAIDIDREGDVRVIANVVPGYQWLSTMVHELGHAVYDEGIDDALPWLLRTTSHPLATEGSAMMLDRLVQNPWWAEGMGLIDAERRAAMLPEARAQLAFSSLLFSRWAQVMLRFERELYRDPDQDLNALWWRLVERYQGLKAPAGRDAPDYASKIHLVTVPVYYQNYMLGELFAAQVHESIAGLQGKAPEEAVYFGDPRVGAFLVEKVFAPGDRWRWDALTERATGKPLGPEAFARRFQPAP
ncbi:MAG: M2 family metallopeptidase [Deltaproteobacteria bacterium]|nr:M2 family metallopeptidase [Deltaproteobacteria bacterium]